MRLKSLHSPRGIMARTCPQDSMNIWTIVFIRGEREREREAVRSMSLLRHHMITPRNFIKVTATAYNNSKFNCLTILFIYKDWQIAASCKSVAVPQLTVDSTKICCCSITKQVSWSGYFKGRSNHASNKRHDGQHSIWELLLRKDKNLKLILVF